MSKLKIDYRLGEKDYSKVAELASSEGISVNGMARELMMESLKRKRHSPIISIEGNDSYHAKKELIIIESGIEKISGNNELKEMMKRSVERLWHIIS